MELVNCTSSHTGLKPDKSYIDILPDEIMMKIFSYFSFYEIKNVISLVSEGWSKLCGDPHLFKSYFIEGTSEYSTQQVDEMLKAAPFLISLTVIQREDLHYILRIISRRNRKLKVLRLNRCRGSKNSKRIDSTLLIKSLKKCPQLEKLIIKNTTLSNGIERFHLYGIGIILPNLRKLTLINNSVVLVEREISLIVETSKRLESIKILQTQGMQLTDNLLEAICCSMSSNLKVLKMNGPLLTDQSVIHLKGCKNIKTLHLKYALRISSNFINAISEMSTITSLDLTMAYNIGTDCWINLFSQEWMKTMLKIVIGQCDAVNDDVLEVIGHNCPILEKLGLAGCARITESGLLDIAMGCKKMIFLDLFYTPVRITKMFYLIPQTMPKLKKLIFRSSNGIKCSDFIEYQLKYYLPDLIVCSAIDFIT